jgi:phosphatidylinositol alpha-mannosyltransferase
MKIAVFTPYNIFIPGGVQEHVDAQVRSLRKRGHDVTILTPRPRLKLNEDAPEGVVFLGTSARIKSPQATSADVSISLDNEAIDEELAKKYDVIHVHEPLVPIAARQILVRAEGHALRVGTFHAALPGNALGKSLLTTFKSYAKSVVPLVDEITAVTPAAIGYIETYANKPITYIPNGIDVESYKPKNVERDQNLIVYINRLEKRKGAMQLLKAFAYLKNELNPNAELKICSDGPLRETLEQYVDDNEIDGVEFLGFISEEQKVDLLSRCGVATYPSLYGESFGIVLVEALAMGAPIVAHPNDGYRWTLRETGRVGLVNCKDAEAYAHRLHLMLEDDAVRRVWQDWAKKYVKQFDYEKIVDAYEELYEKNLFTDVDDSPI